MDTQSPLFQAQVVAISGACGGIGRALAHRFAQLGAHLVLLDKSAADLNALRQELPDNTVRVCSYDQALSTDIERACHDAAAADLFINNAGITLRAPLVDTKHHDIHRVVNINITGAIAMAAGIGSAMVQRQGGRIINVTSQFGMIPAPGRAIYGASKAALAHFTRSAASEWGAKGVEVMTLAPGPVDTAMLDGLKQSPTALQALIDQIPTARLSSPAQIADVVVFMAHLPKGLMNGETFLVDGGFSLPYTLNRV